MIYSMMLKKELFLEFESSICKAIFELIICCFSWDSNISFILCVITLNSLFIPSKHFRTSSDCSLGLLLYGFLSIGAWGGIAGGGFELGARTFGFIEKNSWEVFWLRNWSAFIGSSGFNLLRTCYWSTTKLSKFLFGTYFFKGWARKKDGDYSGITLLIVSLGWEGWSAMDLFLEKEGHPVPPYFTSSGVVEG